MVTTGTPAPSADANVKRGGEVILAGGDLQRLDFQATISTPTQNASSLVYSRLVRYDPYTGANDYGIIPDLAESWEVESDRITFHLKQGVKWPNVDPVNGREFVASDVQYSYERVATDGPEWVHAYKMDPISSIEAPDDYTVVMNLSRPSAGLLSDLASGQGMGLVPRELVEADGDLDTRWIGTGPFMLDRWEQGNRIRFVRNPDYHEDGYPYVDAIEWRFITDSSTNLANFIAGQLSYYALPSLEALRQVQSSTDAMVQTFANLGGTHKMFNVREDGPNPALADVRVRQAIDYALNRQDILDFVLGGDGNIAGPVMPVGYGDWSLSPDEIAELHPENLDEARALITAAGADGLTIEHDYGNTSAFSEDEAPIMQQQLARVGIRLELLPRERTVYLQAQVDGNFSFQGIGMGGYPDPDNFLYPVFHSTGSKNYGGVDDPELDARIEEQQGILEHEERVEFIKNLDRDWKDYLYRIYTVYPNTHQAWSSQIVNPFQPKGWDWRGLQAVAFK
ncbi:MAG: ABC transporter substrate-binding protein [Dehalococcoidia bacterium]|nr:ABC transporter substrate-binding protein [Dehalococcoidia bacterium]